MYSGSIIKIDILEKIQDFFNDTSSFNKKGEKLRDLYDGSLKGVFQREILGFFHVIELASFELYICIY